MNIFFFYLLESLIPLLGNFAGYIVSILASYEFDFLKKYLDISIRIIFVFIVSLGLSQFRIMGLIVLMIFILFSMSKYFWKYENIVILIFAIFVVFAPNILVLTLIFVYFMISTSLQYYELHGTKTQRIWLYPLHAINFIQKYWTYYLFILILNIIILVLVVFG